MTSGNRKAAGPTADFDDANTNSDAQIMAHYGITRVPVDYFHVGVFRYTNLADAVAAAKRQQAAVEPTTPRFREQNLSKTRRQAR